MSAKKTNYQITIGYKAVLTVMVKATTEDDAKKLAMEEFKDKFRREGSNNISIEDDTYGVNGIVNMDATWNML